MILWGLAALVAYWVLAGAVLDDSLADLAPPTGHVVSIPPRGRG